MCLDLEINPFNKESNLFQDPLITAKEIFSLLIRKNVISKKSNPWMRMVHVKRRIVKDNTVIPNNNVKRMSIMPGRKRLTGMRNPLEVHDPEEECYLLEEYDPH